MFHNASKLALIAVVVTLAGIMSPVAAKDTCQPASAAATVPTPRDGPRPIELFARQQASFPREAQFVLLGDSIAQRWKPEWYPPVMKEQKVLNLGLGGDRTENVIWRLEQLPLKQISPSAVFIIIGTNNLRHGDSPCEIFEGITAIVTKARTVWPSAKIIVSEILPRGKNFAYRERQREELNELITSGQTHVGYSAVSADEKALTSNADSPSPTYRSDRLHLLGPGYTILGEALTSAMRR